VKRIAATVAIALAVIAALVLLSRVDLAPRPSPSASSNPPATTSPAATGPSGAATASAASTDSPGGGAPIVGDYRCLTLADAEARIARDGYVPGTHSYAFEGGPADDSWLVFTQDPPPGDEAPPGTAVDLQLGSPALVCR
jgi:hypothetical protein